MPPTAVRRALLSVHDKTGLVDFAQALAARGVVLLSTGGTAKALRAAGLTVKDVAEETGFPEMLDGRVKTLHPRIHGALLGLRDDERHTAAMAEHGIGTIDLVVVNLYPFEATVRRPDVSLEAAIEQIDIGGPAMIRSASKNHRSVGVVTDPSQYAAVLEDLRANDGDALRGAQGVARPRGVRAHGGLRRGDPPVPLDARGRAAAHDLRRGVAGPLPALRREPAPGRRALRRPARAPGLARARAGAQRQGAVLQQLPRRRRGLGPRARARAARRRHRQAHQPLRRRHGGDVHGGVRPRPRGRPPQRLRRHRRVQPALRPRARRAALRRRPLPGGRGGAGRRGRGRRAPARRPALGQELPHPRHGHPASRAVRARRAGHRRRPPPPGARLGAARPEGRARRDEAGAERGRARRALLRVRRRQARPQQRDRPVATAPRPSASAPGR